MYDSLWELGTLLMGMQHRSQGDKRVEEREYVAQTADTGEFIPVLAVDRYQALRELADVSIEGLYMESQSPDTAFLPTRKYERHLVRLKDGGYFILEQHEEPVERETIDKIYVNVELN